MTETPVPSYILDAAGLPDQRSTKVCNAIEQISDSRQRKEHTTMMQNMVLVEYIRLNKY